ncbi:hypothetical protein STEG23_026659, partial [Scotinomys teguina]
CMMNVIIFCILFVHKCYNGLAICGMMLSGNALGLQRSIRVMSYRTIDIKTCSNILKGGKSVEEEKVESDPLTSVPSHMFPMLAPIPPTVQSGLQNSTV